MTIGGIARISGKGEVILRFCRSYVTFLIGWPVLFPFANSPKFSNNYINHLIGGYVIIWKMCIFVIKKKEFLCLWRRPFEKPLRDFHVIITSSSTNQRREFSVTTYVIISKCFSTVLVGEPRPRNERFVHPSPQKRFDSGLLLFDNSWIRPDSS